MKRLGINLINLVMSLLINTNQAFSCVWAPDNGPVLYWPSTRIQICFTNQNLPEEIIGDLSYSQNLTRTRQVVIEAIQEMSYKTDFEFNGFSQCDPNSNEPMIRINFTRREGEGKTESVGPNSAHNQPFNLTLSQIPNNFIQNKMNEENGEITIFNHLTWAKSAAQHEVMHLLGFHHDLPRQAKGWPEYIKKLGDEKLIDSQLDTNSVMAIQSVGSSLSARDISCIDQLATRTTQFNSANKIRLSNSPLNNESQTNTTPTGMRVPSELKTGSAQ